MNAEQTPEKADQPRARPHNREPYQQAYYPPVPTRLTKHMRSNPVWQLVRFFIINWKISRVMRSSNH